LKRREAQALPAWEQNAKANSWKLIFEQEKACGLSTGRSRDEEL